MALSPVPGPLRVHTCGAVAQLGERLTGSQEVGSSILLGSTLYSAYLAGYQLMASNQTNVHKKMDRILQKLAKLDNVDTSLKELRQQTQYLAQLATLSVRLHNETQEALKDISQMARDTALLVSENLKETRAQRNGEKGRRH